MSTDSGADESPGLPDHLTVDRPEQLKALGNELRREVLRLLTERPATTGELAAALDRPPSTVAHHMDVLAEAGLVEVTATRQIRAVTERTWSRTAATFVFPKDAAGELWMLSEAAEHMRGATDDEVAFGTVRFLPLDHERAAELAERLRQVADEFLASDRPAPDAGPDDSCVYGMVLGLMPTDRPSL